MPLTTNQTLIIMKTYKVTLDSLTKALVLTALMEKAQSSKGQARENYLMAYGDIKEELMCQGG